MSVSSAPKLQQLVLNWPPGTVGTSPWFASLGISPQLINRYLNSNWLSQLGNGAYTKTGDRINWQGGLYAIQTQQNLPVYAGALTALALQGYAQNIRLGRESVFLFSPRKQNLPAWFKNYRWEQPVGYHQTSFLPDQLALIEFPTGLFSLKVSAPERAILECLYLSPSEVDLVECYQIMESLTTLRPSLLQSLLEQCSSIKVKRLFLYMADKADHAWLKRLKVNNLELGKGPRTITPGGVYAPQYELLLPRELVNL